MIEKFDFVLISLEYVNFTIFVNRKYDTIRILFHHNRVQRA